MIIKDNIDLSYDLSGNLVLTIPRLSLKQTEQDILLKSIERLIRLESKKNNVTKSWIDDSASNIVGLCESNTYDGSVDHDRDIYGLR